MDHFRTRSEAGRRTNSLAFAKNDCHTCTSLNKECDRRRPRCGTCLSDGRKCDGFAMPLVWQGSETNISPSFPRHLQKGQSCNTAEFKFVQGRPKRKRRPKSSVSSEISRHQGYFPVSTSPSRKAVQERPRIEPVPAVNETAPVSHPEAQLPVEASANSVAEAWDFRATSTDTLSSSLAEPQPQLESSSYLGLDETAFTLPASDDVVVFDGVEEVGGYNFLEFVVPPMVLYQDLAQKYHHILEMCKFMCYGCKCAFLFRVLLAADNKDFCAMPLTYDYHANPFRVRLDRIQESPCLLHAAMALSSQHLAKLGNSPGMATEVHAHQSTAMLLFGEALNHPISESVLDTLLLLIIFEVSFFSLTEHLS